ncbi:UDP-N-acetylmuramyl pentapeptide phosphotransferase/UDP-N-acetylglucosamine-1-phosphate transferase [Marivita geojedonensis]|nr:UDP-N-acetylmuramyl pentapeptide phosphotransferase/UDP-N-acetylglucosamine-1-phosphate transferase [Marivita geojedonensis]
MPFQQIVFFPPEFLILTCLSLALSALLVVLAKHAKLPMDRRQDLTATQAMHETPTPRLGGVAIFSAVILSGALAPAAVSDPYRDFILATAILFLVGLLEDLGVSISPRKRLLACAAASLAAIWLLGVWLPRLGIPGVDTYMDLWLVGVPMTLLVTTGVANGFNLIDGVNGLASLAAMAAAVALAVISHGIGYEIMVSLALMLAAAIFGLFLLNFPFGLIFLGDAGAYTLGFVLSWFGISVLLNAPEVSPWAILLTVFWPLADTLLAIVRRKQRQKDSLAPDRLHVHQLVMRTLEIHVLGRGNRRLANPLSTVVLAPFVLAPPMVAVFVWDQNALAFWSVIAFLILFFGSYAVAFRVLRRIPRKNGKRPLQARDLLKS